MKPKLGNLFVEAFMKGKRFEEAFLVIKDMENPNLFLSGPNTTTISVCLDHLPADKYQEYLHKVLQNTVRNKVFPFPSSASASSLSLPPLLPSSFFFNSNSIH